MIQFPAKSASPKHEASEYGATAPVRVAQSGLDKSGDSAQPGMVTAALLNAVDRLETVLTLESASLRGGQGTSSLDEFNYRKSHGLLELTRAVRNVDPGNVGEDVRQRLLSLRRALESNRLLLKTHLDAAREISGILTAAMRQAESDGTYSAPVGAGGAQ
jgi:hypothetical protein